MLHVTCMYNGACNCRTMLIFQFMRGPDAVSIITTTWLDLCNIISGLMPMQSTWGQVAPSWMGSPGERIRSRTVLSVRLISAVAARHCRFPAGLLPFARISFPLELELTTNKKERHALNSSEDLWCNLSRVVYTRADP